MDIGLINWIRNTITGRKISVWDDLLGEYNNALSMQTAFDTVLGKIINTSQLAVFETDNQRLYQLLNVKPNRNQNANEFRASLLTKLITDGECLIVKVGDFLYIADSFAVDDTVLTEKTYFGVTIDTLDLRRSFKSSEVFHLKYHNEKIRRYVKSLDEAYGKLFNRILSVQMREQQIRIYAKFKMLRKIDKETDAENIERSKQTLKKYLSGAKAEIENESVAMIPLQDDYEPNEKTQTYLGRSNTELGVIENLYLKNIANLLGVNPLLFTGDLADVSQHKRNFILEVIQPLMELFATEVNAKANGVNVSVNLFKVLYASEFEAGKDVRTMIESGVWTMDMILKAMGKKPEGTKITTQRYLTKNIAPLRDDGTVEDGKSAK